jgi:hypothetical protein
VTLDFIGPPLRARRASTRKDVCGAAQRIVGIRGLAASSYLRHRSCIL